MAVDRDALREWHRLFGLLLTDFFAGSPFTVEIERDLSMQQQFLDVVILRKGPGQLLLRLPDGMDHLADHNLLTFKSHRETLDAWALKELSGHDVAYRKLVSASPSELLPADHFKLFAVCARFPLHLSKQVPWNERQQGVYDCHWGTDVVRVIVAGELPRESHNAPLHFFSASPELVGFGQSAYGRRLKTTSNLLWQLYTGSQDEGLIMPYTMEDFNHWFVVDNFAELTIEEQRNALQRLSPEKRQAVLESLSPEQRLVGLPPEKLLARLPPEERLAGLSADQIQRYLDQLKAKRPSRQRKPRRLK